MVLTLLRRLSRLETEEKLLNAGVALTIVSLFFPWLSGRWIADQIRTDTALSLSSYVSFIGLAILVLQGYVLLVTAVPLWNEHTLLRPERKHIVRLYCCAVSSILVLAGLSVLLKVTFDFPSMQIRFGVYSALIGSLLSTLYAFLLVQEQKRKHVRQLFHQETEELVDTQSSLPLEKAHPQPPDAPAPRSPSPEPHRSAAR